MHGVGWIAAIIIGIFAGWVAERMMNRRHGLITNLVVGLVGALIGGFIADKLGIAYAGWIGSALAAIVGAVVLLFILGLFRRR